MHLLLTRTNGGVDLCVDCFGALALACKLAAGKLRLQILWPARPLTESRYCSLTIFVRPPTANPAGRFVLLQVVGVAFERFAEIGMSESRSCAARVP